MIAVGSSGSDGSVITGGRCGNAPGDGELLVGVPVSVLEVGAADVVPVSLLGGRGSRRRRGGHRRRHRRRRWGTLDQLDDAPDDQPDEDGDKDAPSDQRDRFAPPRDGLL